MTDKKPNSCFIDYVEFPCRDFEATRQFFEKLMGWKFQQWGPDYMDFQCEKVSGGFFRSDQSSRQSTGGALVVFKNSDLEGFRDQVVELGGEIQGEILEFPGGRRFHFLEPSGNEFAVWCPVEATE